MKDKRTRIFLKPDSNIKWVTGNTIYAQEDQSHYLLSVLRLRAGDKVEVVNEETTALFSARICSIKKPISLELVEEIESSEHIQPVSCLLFALVKGKKNDLVCEKATELGVDHILFWQAERSVPRSEKTKGVSERLLRLEKIARSAASQSKKQKIPNIYVENSLSEALRRASQLSFKDSLLVYGSLENDAFPPMKLPQNPYFLHLLIGPEGGLSKAELRFLREYSSLPVRFSPWVLRAETAAITGIATLQAIRQA